MQIFLFFALLIAVLAAIFAVQNNAPTNVRFAIWDFQGSVALVLLVALAAGALISFFVSLPSNISARWTIRQQKKKITEIENSVARLRDELEASQRKLELLLAPPAPEKQPEIIAAPTSQPSNLSSLPSMEPSADLPEVEQDISFPPVDSADPGTEH